jgi:hypothetical protein
MRRALVPLREARCQSQRFSYEGPDAPITAAVLTAEFGKFEKKMEHLLSEQTKATEQLLADQATVILDAVEERMDKKLGEKETGQQMR